MNSSYALPFSRRSILRVAAILVIGYALTTAAIQLWAQNSTDEVVRSDNREITTAMGGFLYNGTMSGFAASSDPSVFATVDSASAAATGLSSSKQTTLWTTGVARTHASPRRSIKGFFSQLQY